MAQLALARAEWAAGGSGPALQAAWTGLTAIPAHLEASLWLASSLLVVLSAALVLGSAFFIATLALAAFSHAAHDLGDAISRLLPEWARAALISSLLLLPLCIGEGFLGFLVMCFALGFAYADGRHRLALSVAAVMLWLGLVPVADLAGRTLLALEAAPVATASLSVVQGEATPVQLAQLRRAPGDDLLAQQALALHARRIGEIDEAERRYVKLLEARPRDPVLMTNLANLHFAQGDTEAATALYQRASQQLESATLLFDLSQAHARLFQMEKFEAVMQRAQALDQSLIAEFSNSGDPNFVADLPLPIALIRDRMLSSVPSDRLVRSLTRPLAPGRLGTGPPEMGAAFAAAALLAMLVTRFFLRSSRCTHCGSRVCRRCRTGKPANRICDTCDRVMNRPEASKPSERKLRLAELREREARIEWLARWGALLIPGVAGLLARRPGLGLMGVLLFAWTGASILGRNGLVPDPLSLGAIGPLLVLSTGMMAGFGYLLSMGAGLMIRGRS